MHLQLSGLTALLPAVTPMWSIFTAQFVSRFVSIKMFKCRGNPKGLLLLRAVLSHLKEVLGSKPGSFCVELLPPSRKDICDLSGIFLFKSRIISSLDNIKWCQLQEESWAELNVKLYVSIQNVFLFTNIRKLPLM